MARRIFMFRIVNPTPDEVKEARHGAKESGLRVRLTRPRGVKTLLFFKRDTAEEDKARRL